jgi:phosphatidate cytidylyltransferase
MWRFHAPGQHIVHIALAIFTIVYVGVLGGFMTELRLLNNDNAQGMTALASLLLVAKSSDAGAYLIGRVTGRTKMTPRLSPGKTVEGAFGGIATACATSWAFFQFVAPQLMQRSDYTPPGWLNTILYGLVLAIAAIIGDLAESLLKRDMERKDSSTWLPGLGGVLDVIDSLLVAAPAAYLCWKLGLVW